MTNTAHPSVERWDRFEVMLHGPQDGNPFLDVQFGALFTHQHRAIAVDGFYAGAGAYRVRLMPDTLGEWSYVTQSSCHELDGQTGTFNCVDASPGNHGPVTVRNWQFRGRIAVKAGDDGFNGKFDWAQQGDAFDASVAGPLGIGTVRIEGEGDAVRLTDKDGSETRL